MGKFESKKDEQMVKDIIEKLITINTDCKHDFCIEVELLKRELFVRDDDKIERT